MLKTIKRSHNSLAQSLEVALHNFRKSKCTISKYTKLFDWNLQLSSAPFLSPSQSCPLRESPTEKSHQKAQFCILGNVWWPLPWSCQWPKSPSTLQLGTNPACGGHNITPQPQGTYAPSFSSAIWFFLPFLPPRSLDTGGLNQEWGVAFPKNKPVFFYFWKFSLNWLISLADKPIIGDRKPVKIISAGSQRQLHCISFRNYVLRLAWLLKGR